MYENIARSYKQANYLTANPVRLVIMCYEGTIASLKLAKAAYASKDYEEKGKALQKALDIIHELNASLDVKKGEAIARNLRGLYQYLIRRLVEADLKRDIGGFDEVIRMLEDLHSSWKEIAASHDVVEARPAAYTSPTSGVRAASASHALRV